MIGQPYNYGGVPPNPIGNILNLNQGYMGSYYNPNPFQGYYNPYLVQQQMKQQEMDYNILEMDLDDIIKNTFRVVYKAKGYSKEDIEERLKSYDTIEERAETPYVKSYNEFERFRRVEQYNQQFQNYEQPTVYRDDGIPDDISMYDFFQVAGKLLQDEYYEDLRRKNRNVGLLYDRNEYNKLLGSGNRNNNYFSSVFNNGNNNPVNIDDMEITLPSQINDEYHQRKRAFLDAIIN